MQVKAIEVGYYGGKLREPGEFFTLKKATDFSKVWMVKPDGTPFEGDDHVTGGDVKPDDEPKKTGKKTAAERIALAAELTGRDDIQTGVEADQILAAIKAEGASDEVDNGSGGGAASDNADGSNHDDDDNTPVADDE